MSGVTTTSRQRLCTRSRFIKTADVVPMAVPIVPITLQRVSMFYLEQEIDSPAYFFVFGLENDMDLVSVVFNFFKYSKFL